MVCSQKGQGVGSEISFNPSKRSTQVLKIGGGRTVSFPSSEEGSAVSQALANVEYLICVGVENHVHRFLIGGH